MSIRDFAHVIRNYIVLVIALPILCGAVTGGYLWGMVPDIYSSEGTMMFVGITNNENGAEKSSGSVTLLKTIIDAEPFHNEVFKKMNMADSDDYQIYAAIQGSTNTLKIIAEGPDPNRCAEIANATMDVALERSTASFGEGSASIMTPATPPEHPAAPHRIRYLLAAIIGGLLVAICIALAIDAFKSRWQTAQRIEELLHIPVLAEYPHGFDKLAREIKYASLDEPIRAIAFLSATKDEGSSQVAHGFAEAQVGQGKKTLLVSPNNAEKGLYDVLTSADSLQECVEDEVDYGFDMLALEIAVRSSGSVFASDTFHSVLESQMKPAYDCILFDAPALSPVPDSVSLAAACDAAILVVNKRQKDNELLVESLKLLKKGDTNVFGVVLVTD